MLNEANALKNFTLNSLDGAIGETTDFYFDDKHWTVRYLVVNTKNWLKDRCVLISPNALISVIDGKKQMGISLSKKQIENSPPLDSNKPVSRQFEEAYYGYYGWPMYWNGPSMKQSDPYLIHDRKEWRESAGEANVPNSNLRSTQHVKGYYIHAKDGEIGHVEDFIIDDKAWVIRYLVINTRNWWSGKKVLISPEWIERISWSESKVFVNLSCELIVQSPDYTEKTLLNRKYETDLHRHYERKGYWIHEGFTGETVLGVSP